jgi:hypothetical protein
MFPNHGYSRASAYGVLLAQLIQKKMLLIAKKQKNRVKACKK